MSENLQSSEVVINQSNTTAPVDTKMLYTVWGLMAAVFIPVLGFIAFIASVIVAYIQRGKTTHPVERDNYTYAIRTFWFSLLWSIMGYLTLIFIVGFAILGAAVIWFVYRVIKGFLYAKSGTMLYQKS